MKADAKTLIAAALFSAIAAPALADALDGPAIQQLLSDATATGETSKGKTFTIRYEAGGAARFGFDDGSFSDTGVWSVDGNRYCAQWVKTRDGVRGCWTVQAQGADVYLFNGLDGMNDVVLRVSP